MSFYGPVYLLFPTGHISLKSHLVKNHLSSLSVDKKPNPKQKQSTNQSKLITFFQKIHMETLTFQIHAVQ